MPRRSSTDPLAALAVLLLGSARKASPVLLARDAPAQYARTHARELRQRGVSSTTSVPHAALIWIALVNAMRRDHRAAEIDWRSPPDEVTTELEALRPAIPRAAWASVRQAIEDEIATDEFLRLLARAVRRADPARVIAALDRPSDTIVVAPLKAADLPVAARLMREAGIGTIRDLARLEPRKPAPTAGRRRAGGWSGFLAKLNAANTHAVLLAAANDRAVASALARHVNEAPKSEREVIRVFLAVLANGTRMTTEDPLTALEGLRYLSFAPGHERRCLEHTCDVVTTVAPRARGIRFVRTVVATIRFALRPTEAAAAFRTLRTERQRALRGVVHEALTRKEPRTLVAALDAARVVGDGDTMRLVKALTAHPLPVVATHAKRTNVAGMTRRAR